jgi:hypothetical protein
MFLLSLYRLLPLHLLAIIEFLNLFRETWGNPANPRECQAPGIDIKTLYSRWGLTRNWRWLRSTKIVRGYSACRAENIRQFQWLTMESGHSGSKLSGPKLIRSQGQEIIFTAYTFMEMEEGQETEPPPPPHLTDTGRSEELYCCWER